MVSRRAFVAACGAAAPVARWRWLPRLAAHTPLVCLLLGEASPAATHGAAIGANEVLQTSQLLGHPINVPVVRAATVGAGAAAITQAGRTGALAVVAGGNTALVNELATQWPARGPLLVATTPLDQAVCRPQLFGVAPTAADRAAARTAWAARKAEAVSTRGTGPADVTAWAGSLIMYGADSLNERFRAAWPNPPVEEEWLQWFALKTLAEAALRSQATNATQLRAALRGGGSDGHKGVLLRFDSAQRLVQPLYVTTPPDDAGEVRVLFTWQPPSGAPLTGACA